MNDYRYNPFENVSTAVTITGETHVIPSVSPYTIRLNEVPMKDTPSTISLTIGGVAANEVSASPASGEFWPDYSTKADNDDSWNTGTILFNAADAGKTVVVSYIGTGSLVDIEKTSKLHKCIKFTSSGEWICPEGVEHVNILLIGGGGGGNGLSNTSRVKGTDGGDSSLGSLLTAGGGIANSADATVPAGSIFTSEIIPILIANFNMGVPGKSGAIDATGHGSSGACVGLGGIVTAGVPVNTEGAPRNPSGGGCFYAAAVPVTPGESYSIVVGAGGIGGDGSTYDGGDGSSGICIIWY